MSSKPVCPQGSICSLPYTANVGTNQTLLYFFTSTKVTQDSQGKVNGGTTTLYYSPKPGQYIPSASTSNGGKTWNYLKKEDGNFILGDDARKSLQQGVLKTNTNTFVKDALVKSSVPEEQAKTLQLNQNTASSNATTGGDTQGGNPSPSPNVASDDSQTKVDLTKLEKINPGYVRTTYGDPMRYPLTMNTSDDKDIIKQDVIKFTMYEYTPSYTFSKNGEISSYARNKQIDKKTPKGTVILPIQPTIVDSNSVNWQEDSIDPLMLAAIDASTGFIEGGPEGLTKAISGAMKRLGAEGNDNLGNALRAAIVSQAIGKNIFTRTTGAILNPNMELLFNGPSLRQFSYSFNLSARSAPESRAIQRIIRFFKQGMSVQRSAGELFLVTPDIFQIQYLLKEDKNHPYINLIKTCALTNCSVDYTPTGSYMTFKDGAMVSYTLNLSFEELEPIYHDDYERLGEDVIGY